MKRELDVVLRVELFVFGISSFNIIWEALSFEYFLDHIKWAI